MFVFLVHPMEATTYAESVPYEIINAHELSVLLARADNTQNDILGVVDECS